MMHKDMAHIWHKPDKCVSEKSMTIATSYDTKENGAKWYVPQGSKDCEVQPGIVVHDHQRHMLPNL